MLTFAVMPCLNEEKVVRNAVSSLLGPVGSESRDAHVVVVDNGSTDRTLDVLAELRAAHSDRLHVTQEVKRGYVAPRRRGVEEAASLAKLMSVDPQDVLILQTDADTIYRQGYIDAMRTAAAGGRDTMLEGATRRSDDFTSAHPDYVAAERSIDAPLEGLEADDEDDVVIDDKVSGFRLSDYLRWGGLFEETTSDGSQIHAETTRMFIRARLMHGARKVRVNPAGAAPSRRRVLENPRLHFSTLGFPREASWIAKHGDAGPPIDVDAFARAVLGGGEREAVRLRTAHLLALFRYLPALVASSELQRADLPQAEDVRAALSAMPPWTRNELADRPGAAILDLLRFVDERGSTPPA